MTSYSWNHVQCNGCQTVLTTSSSKNNVTLPGGTTMSKAGWRTKKATATHPRRDYCPVCIKAGRAA